jgi:hypothetical protein
VAHLQRKCSCYVRGATCGDPPGMSKREAAKAAVRLYEDLKRLGVDPFAPGPVRTVRLYLDLERLGVDMSEEPRLRQ